MAIPVDLILTGAAVLTVDEAGSVVADGAVAVRDGRIVAVGPSAEIVAQYDPAELLPSPGCVIMPGWVNTHTHLAMNLFRGAADDVTLEEFLSRLVAAELRVLSAETVSVGARAAIAECLKGGTTTALDMYWYPQATRMVAREVGFRLLNGPTFMGDGDPDGRDFEGVLALSEQMLRDNRAERPDEDLWVMPHSSYTLNRDQLRRIRELASRFGARINTHCAESTGEIDLVHGLHGERPVAALASADLIDESTVLAHAVHLTDEEIAWIADAGATVAHCPVSNLKLGCGIARLPELVDARVSLGLGTDGAASAGALDMFAAARMAALLHKGVGQDPTLISAEQAVRLGTVGGARGVGLTDVGTVETNMRADLQVVDIATLNGAPITDPWAAVVYGASAGDVRHTVVDGKIVMRDRVLQTIDEAEAIRELDVAARKALSA